MIGKKKGFFFDRNQRETNEIIFDLGLIDTVPPWYSSIKPQSVYETAEVQAYWDVPVYGEYQELRANRVDARIVNNRDKQVIGLEVSCPWVRNRDKKTFENTMKYAPVRWELRQRYPGYEIIQCNIILDVLGDGPRIWMSLYRS